MIGNLLHSKSFTDYIANCRHHLQAHRFIPAGTDPQLILDMNTPFELRPHGPITCGVLMVHGLFDCPFSVKEIAQHLQGHGALCRAVLLPGHGTNPQDLEQVTYQDWIDTVTFGLQTLKAETDHIFILGYSTGATLAIHQALCDPTVAGIISIAPLVTIKTLLSRLLHIPKLAPLMKKRLLWLRQAEELNAAKYSSICFNSVYQVDALTQVVKQQLRQQALNCAHFMTISSDDQVVSCRAAVELFSKGTHPASHLLLYSVQPQIFSDKRIEVRPSAYPHLSIKHFSHLALPFSAHNAHYGETGQFNRALHDPMESIEYGAYGNVTESLSDWLYRLHVIKLKRRELTYNPDFDYMINEITQFIEK